MNNKQAKQPGSQLGSQIGSQKPEAARVNASKDSVKARETKAPMAAGAERSTSRNK